MLNDSKNDGEVALAKKTLENLFQELGENMTLSSHPLIVRIVCKLLGNFGQSFNRAEYVRSNSDRPPLLLVVCRYLMSSLKVPQAQATSSVALCQICTSCANRLNHIQVINELVDAMEVRPR